MYQWTGNVGLANVSDILKASINPSCKSVTDNFDKLMQDSPVITCDSNYLLDLPDSTGFWTINAFGSESGSLDGLSASPLAWSAARFSGLAGLGSYGAYYADYYGARPVLYLKSDITLTGEGTEASPFQIS